MDEVKCPDCGVPMILRTARRGRNAGKHFYGCSRYPRCKATRPYYGETPDLSSFEPHVGGDGVVFGSKGLIFPRILRARPKLQSYQVRFFQTCVVPEILMENIRNDEINNDILRAFSQCRMDSPLEDSNYTSSNEVSQIISVLEKILTRGRVTFLSQELENALLPMFLSASPPDFPSRLVDFMVYSAMTGGLAHEWFDSVEEKSFYDDVLPRLFGSEQKRFVMPQIEVSSLIGADQRAVFFMNQRVDFGIFHPAIHDKIIVEIDGEQHRDQKETDSERDQLLRDHGYTVLHIPVEEIRNGTGLQLANLQRILSTVKEKKVNPVNSDESNLVKFILALNIAYRIQLAILQALQSGYLSLKETGSWKIVTDVDEIGIFSHEESGKILEGSVTDFITLLTNVCRLYQRDVSIASPTYALRSDYEEGIGENLLHISFLGKRLNVERNVYIQSVYFPHDIVFASHPTSSQKRSLIVPKEDDLEYFLHYLFRKEHFWEGQYEGILRALQVEDVLLLLPTGAGKSLVYQFSSLLLPGRTIVIDPIISLMDDQIDNLSFLGIDRCIAITSQIVDREDKSRAMHFFGQGEYLFAYVSPERFQTTEFRDSLRALTVHTPISLIVVDEAHCVSEWGHDFRTAYLNIGRTTRVYCESGGNVPPLVALTGTASRAVLKDVQRELRIRDFDAIITPKTFDREELEFNVIHSKSSEKYARLKGFMGQMLPSLFGTTGANLFQTRGNDTYSGLVFCPHVNGEFGVVQISQDLRNDLGISTDYYSGKVPKMEDKNRYNYRKKSISKSFKRNKIPLMVCTKAFGMGIDKPNIRYTIHYGLPASIEAFYQEAGRAGRDRRKAYCYLMLSNDDPKRSERLLNPRTRVEEIGSVIESLKWEEKDDITRMLYFHADLRKGAFRGIDQEKRDIEEVMQYIGNVSITGKQTVAVSSLDRNRVEKSLHRLLLIGIIGDYTVDYNKNEFVVELTGANKEEIIDAYGEYVASYLTSRRQTEVEKARRYIDKPFPKFVREMISLLLNFVYDVIEKGRRRALSEMLLACTEANDAATMRRRILNYLETTAFSEDLEKILSIEVEQFDKTKDIFSIIRAPNEAAELRGQVIRYLESYPDHPSLLMLRALSELYVKEGDPEVSRQNFVSAIDSGLQTYSVDSKVMYDFAVWGLSYVQSRDDKLVKDIIDEMLSLYKSEVFARLLISNMPTELAIIPAWFLLNILNEKCIEILQ